ncbi:D-glycerate dehydrogenase, partial [Candidatus Woesearchaeota archaeon CG_4_10_14_0_8_um_filter_47_5]
GPVIDEQALIEALQKKKIFGAALDVFEHEPVISDELRRLDNAIIVPHIASASFETRSLMATIAAQNILNAFKGAMPVSLVNPDVLPRARIKIHQ